VLRTESEPSPPSSRCVLSGGGVRVSIYLDASYAARQRYYNRIVEQVQFYGTDPRSTPQGVAGVGDRSSHEHTASWIPAHSTLFAVRGNRWVTVAYSDPAISRPQRREKTPLRLLVSLQADRSLAGGISTIRVTGPSLISATPMQAPKTPFFAPSRSQKRSYSGSATSGRAAST
jgi:hypothetical protein